MFNDLLEALNKGKFIPLAYADDLAVIGAKMGNLEKAINIIEN